MYSGLRDHCWSSRTGHSRTVQALAILASVGGAIASNGSCVSHFGPQMKLVRVAEAAIARPFGDDRTVQQAFPGGVAQREADPFLMCDYFNMPGADRAADPDHFPVDWHPHRGMDILSYLRTGVGRHGDSLGNREEFATPGMQWISVGSGIEHAEGGATPRGMVRQGFQIWLNVPSSHKMDDPSYGTEPPEAIPQHLVAPGVNARLLAGLMNGKVGAFKTKTAVQIVDFELEPSAAMNHSIPNGLDCAMLYVYEGRAVVNGHAVGPGAVAVLDATTDHRGLAVTAAGDRSVFAMLFAGRRLNEPVVAHGPIVMNTRAQVEQAFRELRAGTFPPVRVDWDYKRIAAKPKPL